MLLRVANRVKSYHSYVCFSGISVFVSRVGNKMEVLGNMLMRLTCSISQTSFRATMSVSQYKEIQTNGGYLLIRSINYFADLGGTTVICSIT